MQNSLSVVAAQRSIAVAQQRQGSVMSVCVMYKVIGTTSDTLLARGSSSGTNGFLRWNAVDITLHNSYSYNC